MPTEREAAFFADHGLVPQICGVGMAECAAATAHLLAERLSSGQQPDLVILAGIAGAYTDELVVGDTVIVASETVADLGRRNSDGGFTPLFQKTYSAALVPEGFPVAHSNTVNMAGGIGCTGGKSEPLGPSSIPAVHNSARYSLLPSLSVLPPSPTRPAIENMEGAAFFAVCERFGIQAMEVRTISNRVGEPVTSEGLDAAARCLAADLAKIIRRLSERR